MSDDRGHRWSGWPGAYCLDCFRFSVQEVCATSHAHADLDPERGVCVVPCQEPPCTGSAAAPADDERAREG